MQIENKFKKKRITNIGFIIIIIIRVVHAIVAVALCKLKRNEIIFIKSQHNSD